MGVIFRADPDHKMHTAASAGNSGLPQEVIDAIVSATDLGGVAVGPASVLTNNVLKCTSLSFADGSVLTLGAVDSPFIAIVAKTILFQQAANVGVTVRFPPHVSGQPGPNGDDGKAGPDGNGTYGNHRGYDGGLGQDGYPGGRGQTKIAPTVYIFTNEVRVPGGGNPDPNMLSFYLLLDGFDGGRGGRGGDGGNGGNGHRGNNAADGFIPPIHGYCLYSGGDGGNGGNAGNGGQSGQGADGSQGASVFYVAPQTTLDEVLIFTRLRNAGGNPGSPGIPGLPGRPGTHGDGGSGSHFCSGGRQGSDGTSGATPVAPPKANSGGTGQYYTVSVTDINDLY